MMIHANERERALRQVSECEFAAIEAGLYLDSHPHDREALCYQKKACEQAAAERASYERRFGPLTMCGGCDGEHWLWTATPWPWETEER